MALTKLPKNAIADGAVDASKIEDGAITSGKISDATTISISKTPIGALPPTISSLDTTQINPSSGATVTITGTRFVSIPNVVFLNTSTGARINASTIGFTSSTTITAAFPTGQTAGTYKVQVENPDGQGVLSTASIIYSIAPTWSTAANLGSVEEGESVNISLVAYDDDSTAVTSYTLVSGSLPSGVTLSGDSTIGTLTGTAPTVSADTAYTFTIRATDNENQTSDRQFNLTITNWTVDNSLRFNQASGDYLNRTPSTGVNRRTFTFSAWIKRARINDYDIIFEASNGSHTFQMATNPTGDGDCIRIYDYSGGNNLNLKTSQAFRDLSAWYHIVLAVDTTQGTDTNRLKLYVNGEQATSFSAITYPSQNLDTALNNSVPMQIGRQQSSSNYFHGYMCEVVFIDGSQLAADSFGEFDEDSGTWKPIDVSGLTFGTNGFYLDFEDSGALGDDVSSNGNDFTVNNLTAVDQSTDTPQNNYATLNPIGNTNTQYANFSEGNLKVAGNSGSSAGYINSTIAPSQGKWYMEFKAIDIQGSSYPGVGIISTQDATNNGQVGGATNSVSYRAGGTILSNGSVTDTESSYTDNDIIGIALDLDNGAVYFSKNGTWQNSGDPTSGASRTGSLYNFTPSDFYHFGTTVYDTTAIVSANFGSPPFTISSGNADANGYGSFEYAVPSGYFALNTKNLAEYG